jgi:hypothetical protein
VLEVLVKPKQLFVAADGPRTSHPTEAVLCEAARKIVLDGIDWDCEVKTLFQKENIGCGLAPVAAIDWFFEHVSQGIILEDDCLPVNSFFTFCETLLNKYKDDERVQSIAGSNLMGYDCGDTSYFFSYQAGIWGWATWKRAWDKYDFNVSNWGIPEIAEQFSSFFKNPVERSVFVGAMEKTYNKKEVVTAWDYQLMFARITNFSFGIIPKVNLISNIGFGEDATHTKDINSVQNNIPSKEILFPLIDPLEVAVNEEYDSKFSSTFYLGFASAERVGKKNKIKSYLLKGLKGIKLETPIKRLLSPEKKKWEAIEYFDPQWKERIQKMAAYIEPNASIMDLGCGKMWLKEYIKSTNKYIGVDYIKRDENTIVCDLNKKEFPSQNVDFIFISGCMEYVKDTEWLAKKVAQYSNNAIVSYCSTDHFGHLETRKTNAWVNNLSRDQVVDLYIKNGFFLKDECLTASKNSIFFFKKVSLVE